MRVFPTRLLVICAAAGSVCACASAQGGQSVDMSQLGELGEGPVQPVASPVVRPHRFFVNPFFHRASYERLTGVKALSSSSAIAEICAHPEGKAVLDRDLPGLTDRPEYPFFKHMSLQTLKKMSRGQMSDEDVAKVDADLARLAPRQTASLP